MPLHQLSVLCAAGKFGNHLQDSEQQCTQCSAARVIAITRVHTASCVTATSGWDKPAWYWFRMLIMSSIMLHLMLVLSSSRSTQLQKPQQSVCGT